MLNHCSAQPGTPEHASCRPIVPRQSDDVEATRLSAPLSTRRRCQPASLPATQVRPMCGLSTTVELLSETNYAKGKRHSQSGTMYWKAAGLPIKHTFDQGTCMFQQPRCAIVGEMARSDCGALSTLV